jgi:hypothetical protein
MKNLPNKFVRKTIIFTLAIFLQATISYAEELTIKIGEVQEIPIDEIGILNQQNGGLRQDIWSGSDPTFIQNLLPTLPVETDSKTVQKLIKSVLLSSTTALVADDNQQTSMFNTRLKLLAKSGDAENIEKMLALVPQQKVNEEMYKIYTTAYFLAGNYKDACLKTNEYLKQYSATFWKESQTVCYATENKQTNVEFNLDLMKEDGYTLSKEYLSAIQLFSENKTDLAKEQFNLILQNSVLKLPKALVSFPDVNDIKNSKLKISIGKIKDLPIEQRTLKTLDIFASAETFDSSIPDDIWKQFVMFAATNNITIPDYAAFKLLEKSKADGEKILTIIHVFAKTKTNEIPQYLFVKILSTLNQMGFEKEALQLASERLL